MNLSPAGFINTGKNHSTRDVHFAEQAGRSLHAPGGADGQIEGITGGESKMILQIRDKIIEFDQKDKNMVLNRIQPEGEVLDDASLQYVRANLAESGVYIQIHQIKPFKGNGGTAFIDWRRQDISFFNFVKKFKK
jgi:Na+-transporting NADH:ubiquinone oxidoreductase subunit NqrA